ncbi:hypothetical protein G6F46_007324 [Rhizopus delemar]|uniref:peptidylprolyl isomerase n=2 Tax=Rhizopus TaxID=4842 RepID=A0A9P6Z147_9FUNG|nr:hypothetical protein G6F43_008250 [Rhizopus delemar]KAG1553041.1 hypothetical protein G6F51_000840 [Rhizopus arrhizus]KAG1466816.1 hypothetical protein G6F55_000243 [Rhizopus delemar]KAG1525468.1 hypothetical protein G6F52_003304 [Rhizopus delemar]KAG1562325.1 hypothetical protein G6F49_001015 [Rhizopus delemar]
MFSFMLYKCLLLLLLVVSVCLANKESEMEQPTKLLGGVLHKPEKCGFKADTSSTVKLHYRARAWGQDTFFENTYQREAPLEFKLGKRKLVKEKGMEDGIDGMCAGEVRRLLIPANQAYGELGLSNLVPPNTAIVVDVEMVEVISQFSNPWFWVSGLFLCVAFYLYMQQAQQGDSTSPGAFLAAQQQGQPSQEKKDQ